MSVIAPSLVERAEDAESEADFLIGTILVVAGRLTPEDRDVILRFQKGRDLLFCEAGLSLGLLKRDDVRFALAERRRHLGDVPRQSPLPLEILAVNQSSHPCVEAIRTVRSQLMLRWLDKTVDGKCLAVVGVEDRVGRSFITANLAVLFSQLGQRTLLIDADMRSSRLHQIFNLHNWPGLSSMLAGQADQGAIIPISAVPGLSVLPAGPVPSNPQELLSGQKFKTIIEIATRNYDVVLFDTPAWKCGADAQIISSRAGAALLVTRPARSEAQPTIAFLDMLGQSGVRVVGAVMNRF